MRQLVTIRQVEEVAPIDGADNIEKVRVGLWWCVTKKGDLKAGDLCVYHEIDSFLPIISEYSFLVGKGVRKMLHEGQELQGYHLRTVKLRGQISQGLAMPLNFHSATTNTNLGADVTDLLGVLKYEPSIPAELNGDVEGPFPSCCPKTDEERIQNLEYTFAGKLFSATEKLDGTSCTILMKDGIIRVCGRNWELKRNPDNSMWKVALGIKKSFEGFAIQGELVGPGIQGNPLKLQVVTFFVFYIYDFVQGVYLSTTKMVEVCQDLKLNTVPILDLNLVGFENPNAYLKYADRRSVLNQNTDAEGVVFRLKSDDGHKISFKAISNRYLIKHDL